MGSRGGGRWELLVFLLHLARFARALRGDWHRLGKRTDGFYFVDNRITPEVPPRAGDSFHFVDEDHSLFFSSQSLAHETEAFGHSLKAPLANPAFI